MEENFKNEYEKYSFIIREIIGQKLKDITPVKEEDGYSHYVLENGLHVYVEDSDIWVSKDTKIPGDIHVTDREYNCVTDVELCVPGTDIPNDIELTYGDTASWVRAKIAITPDSTTKIFLPREFGFGDEERDTIIQESHTDMRQILEEKLKDDRLSIEARGAYTRAINLLDMVLELTRNELVVSETTREDQSKATRKEELIAKIVAAQQEGKKIDAQILEAKAKTNDNK